MAKSRITVGSYRYEIKEKFEEFLKAIPDCSTSDILFAWFRMLRIHHQVVVSESVLQDGVDDSLLFNSLYIALEIERGRERFAENTRAYELIENVGTMANSSAEDWNLFLGTVKSIMKKVPNEIKQNINYTIEADGKR